MLHVAIAGLRPSSLVCQTPLVWTIRPPRYNGPLPRMLALLSAHCYGIDMVMVSSEWYRRQATWAKNIRIR